MNTSNSLKTRVPTKPSANPAQPIYLDNHATTQLDPRVLEAMLPYLRDNFGNPASTHIYGIRAAYAVDQARLKVAAAIQAEPEEIIFTAGATESNNFVIKGVFDHFRNRQPHVIVSAIEHKCILEAAKHIERQGAKVTILPVTREGLVEPEQLRQAIRPNTVLVSVMLANNEIGSINPIRELSSICHEHDILFHTDAAQAIGKLPLSVAELGIDLLSASGHKFYGPKGAGFVYVKNAVKPLLTPLLDGGGQESNLRSGTLDVPGIVGIGTAIELATEELDADFWHYLKLRNQLYTQLKTDIPELLLNGPAIDSLATLQRQGDLSEVAASLARLPNNLNVTIPLVDATKVRQKLSGVAFSSGSACSSEDPEPSYVLIGIGRTRDEAQASFRFGVGRFNTEGEIEQSAGAFAETVHSLLL